MLSALMKKGGLVQQVTATPATYATTPAANQSSVAAVATVAVAAPRETTNQAEEEAAIYRWLAYIGEHDEVMINEVLNKCRHNPEALSYVLREAMALPQAVKEEDDRRHCNQCIYLLKSGLCTAACLGKTSASRKYHPVDDIPRRCVEYVPRPEYSVQHIGRKR